LNLPGQKPRKTATSAQVQQHTDSLQALERFGERLTAGDSMIWLRSVPSNIIDDSDFIVALAEQFSPGALNPDR